jgi:NAD(P)-dependent dehydrogenase (short-subunit alcohol dehydrogenase family)
MVAKMQGKVALVTGAGSGIGRAAALAFANEGAKVIVNDIAIEGGKETVDLIKQAKGEATFVKADVTRAVEVKVMTNKAIEKYGRLDYAFNNAGVAGYMVGVVEYSEEDWDRVLSINLKSVWLCMKYEIPHMLKHGGAIVNASSTMGLVGGVLGHALNPAYVASKHGVVGLSKQAALEYATKRVRINAVCPGYTDTPMNKTAGEDKNAARDLRRRVNSIEPIRRMGTPEEVAGVVIWLCSDAASFVIGHAMPVDGGWTAY